MSRDEITNLNSRLDNIKNLVENNIQQHSGHYSDILKHLQNQDAVISTFKSEVKEELKSIKQEISTIKIDTKPAILVTTGAKTTFKVILWGAVSISTIGGAYLVLVNIF